MKVAAVGFLFQNKVKGMPGNNYTCIIHKVNEDGDYNKDVISSPLVNKKYKDVVTPEIAKEEITQQLKGISSKKSGYKFIGATIKDGIKETEIHSLLSDKLFAVRTKNDKGKNKFTIEGKDSVRRTLARNLYINA